MKKLLAYSTALLLFMAFPGCCKDCHLSEECELVGETGPCNANFPSYYYDHKKDKCVEFTWGGCDGVRPFETLEECENRCHCE